MTSENQQDSGQQFNMQRIYLKDVSFESPNSPEVFAAEEWKPEINIQLNSGHKAVGTDTYEVILNITVTAKQNSKTAFLVEVKQAGIFLIKGFGEDQLDGMLGAYCPETLFPYAREAISGFVTKGGFPQFLIAPVNFNLLYAQSKQQAPEATQDTAH